MLKPDLTSRVDELMSFHAGGGEKGSLLEDKTPPYNATANIYYIVSRL